MAAMARNHSGSISWAASILFYTREVLVTEAEVCHLAASWRIFITLMSFVAKDFSWVSRKCNFVAHNFAKWARWNQVAGVIPLDNRVPIEVFKDNEE
ncbi:hypothetical protein L484_013544 [Morus notabilis]|uniref:Uncharacterized protein n=1 Tax=Morus notabilis TaxID=981085 RepID=W9QGU7_9ROSA|nr:hypothetical protein L484_013544 [Morus notabilis]